VVNSFNPKVALFFLAFLLQFIDQTRAQGPQLLVFGAIFFVIALVSDMAYALIAGTAAAWLGASSRAERARRVVSGTVTIGLGVTAAFTGNGSD
jgi:threonine/homoserine/homoserine lactone efflux protein